MQLYNKVIFLLFFQTIAGENDIVPTFLLDYEEVMKHLTVNPNPFNKISSGAFVNIIHDAIKRSEAVVIFVEDTFCFEDLSVKDKLGTPYYYLRRGLLDKKVKYFPSVISPYDTLKQVLQPQQLNLFYLSPGTKLHLTERFKYLYIYFKDGMNETRAQALRRHDAFIREVYFTVRQLKPGPIVAFYTGKINPVVVERPRFVPIRPSPLPRDDEVMVASEGALFRFSGVFATTPTRRANLNQMPMIAEESWTPSKLSTKMDYTDFELQFNFNLEKAEGWLLESVALVEGGEEVGRTEVAAGAPWDWSYVCGEPLTVLNQRDGSSVTISQYQLQPFRYPPISRNGSDNAGGNDTSMCFGATVNCGPYFNTRILSGLMVVFLFLMILAYGIATLFDCGVNDKQDDPHGKPLFTDVPS
ncbi:uncharacterized protein LOC115449314 [Manduca sexta]|uniref:V-type proton ATPase subunit S1/VOA1 transmembrane domain-containing protein n=1 Tax=Manduca sexta TaxID=7130 RepID=A0A922CV05_MANSE|nr:uncharacterized protein LOC115449314 [Manduca sexta]KAG6459171.1 hypothetical protein O3G_MSEX011247 [Manduca sexta]